VTQVQPTSSLCQVICMCCELDQRGRPCHCLMQQIDTLQMWQVVPLLVFGAVFGPMTV
jgi:hypothetical protein